MIKLKIQDLTCIPMMNRWIRVNQISIIQNSVSSALALVLGDGPVHEVELVDEEPLGMDESFLNATKGSHVGSTLAMAHHTTVAALGMHLS